MPFTYCKVLLAVWLKPLPLFRYLQVVDLTRVSQELAYLASDADLVILEGMVSSFLNNNDKWLLVSVNSVFMHFPAF